MKLYDITDLAVRNLRESIFRNSLTTIGISVGVASLVAMLSLGIGLQQLASRQLQKSGLFNTVLATSRHAIGNFREQRENATPAAESPELDEAARKKIEQIPGVAEAYPDIRFVTDVVFDSKTNLTMVAGIPFSAKNNGAFDGMQGSFFLLTLHRRSFCKNHLPKNCSAKRPLRAWTTQTSPTSQNLFSGKK